MDPLAQLKDIHTPEPIHNYPVAIGWWIVTIATIVLLIWLWRKFAKAKKLKQQQKLALANLESNDLSIADIQATLKWAALSYFPRQQVASLYGEKWLAFLKSNLPDKHQTTFNTLLAETNVFESQYQAIVNKLRLKMR